MLNPYRVVSIKCIFLRFLGRKVFILRTWWFDCFGKYAIYKTTL